MCYKAFLPQKIKYSIGFFTSKESYIAKEGLVLKSTATKDWRTKNNRGVKQAPVWMLALPLISCENLLWLFNLSEAVSSSIKGSWQYLAGRVAMIINISKTLNMMSGR